MHRRTGTISK